MERDMKHETLYQELINDAGVISKLLDSVTQAEASYKPQPEAWSILEVLCHLYDEEREDFRAHLDLILHHPHEPWTPINPQDWVISRKYNQRDLAEMLSNFVDERRQSLSWLKSLLAPDWEIKYTSHWGSMKAGDMLSAWVAHDNLHIRQLVDLKRARLLNFTAPYDVRYAGDW